METVAMEKLIDWIFESWWLSRSRPEYPGIVQRQRHGRDVGFQAIKSNLRFFSNFNVVKGKNLGIMRTGHLGIVVRIAKVGRREAGAGTVATIY